jgi:hypothetical protein
MIKKREKEEEESTAQLSNSSSRLAPQTGEKNMYQQKLCSTYFLSSMGQHNV